MKKPKSFIVVVFWTVFYTVAIQAVHKYTLKLSALFSTCMVVERSVRLLIL